jgi:hypothetical protein
MGDCTDVWKDGIRYLWEDGMDSISKEALNCKVKSADGMAVLVMVPDDMSIVDRFLESIPKYTPQTLRDDGVYTWLLYSKAESPETVSFVAMRTKSALEVGTLHKAIGRAVHAHKVHGGGELRKTGNRIEFNTLSGTYVSKWLDSRNKKRYCPPEELEEMIQMKFKELFPGHELVLNATTYIVNSLPLLPEDLEEYRRAGFIVEVYDTFEACKEGEKAAIKRILAERRARRAGRRTRKPRRQRKSIKRYPRILK